MTVDQIEVDETAAALFPHYREMIEATNEMTALPWWSVRKLHAAHRRVAALNDAQRADLAEYQRDPAAYREVRGLPPWPWPR